MLKKKKKKPVIKEDKPFLALPSRRNCNAIPLKGPVSNMWTASLDKPTGKLARLGKAPNLQGLCFGGGLERAGSNEPVLS